MFPFASAPLYLRTEPALPLGQIITGGSELEYSVVRNGRIFESISHPEGEGEDRIYYSELLREANLREYNLYHRMALSQIQNHQNLAERGNLPRGMRIISGNLIAIKSVGSDVETLHP